MRGPAVLVVPLCAVAVAASGCGGDDPPAASSAGPPSTTARATRPAVRVGVLERRSPSRPSREAVRALRGMGVRGRVVAVRSDGSTVNLGSGGRSGDDVCITVEFRGEGGSAGGCSSLTAVAAGTQFVGSRRLAAGVVPDGARRVTVAVVGGRSRTVRVRDNTWVAPADDQLARIRFSSPSTGPVDFRLP